MVARTALLVLAVPRSTGGRRPPPVESVLTGGPDRPRPGSMVTTASMARAEAGAGAGAEGSWMDSVSEREATEVQSHGAYATH